MGLIQWATSPWGQNVPIHAVWGLIWVAVIAGFFFMIVHGLYVAIVSPTKKFATHATPAEAAKVPEHVARHSLAGAAVSLDHGAVDVCAADHGVSAQGRGAV